MPWNIAYQICFFFSNIQESLIVFSLFFLIDPEKTEIVAEIFFKIRCYFSMIGSQIEDPARTDDPVQFLFTTKFCSSSGRAGSDVYP